MYNVEISLHIPFAVCLSNLTNDVKYTAFMNDVSVTFGGTKFPFPLLRLSNVNAHCFSSHLLF